MGTGYVRNDTGNNISDNNVIDASDLDGEFDAIVAAFNETTGHTHDGTSAEGGPITVVGPAQNVSISGTVVEPSVDDTVSLGSASKEFKDLHLDGTANIDSLVADTADINAGTIDNTVIGGTTPAAATVTTMTTTGAGVVGTTLDVTGATTLGSTLDTTGATTLSSTLDVTGATTLGSTLDVTGATTVDDFTATGTTTLATVDINGGAIDGTTVGATSATTGAFTSLAATGTAILATVDINAGAIDGTIIGGATPAAATVTDLTATGTSTLTTVDINGGAVDGTIIGANASAAGTFTNLTSTGISTHSTVDINGGAVDGTTIGASSAAAGTFTNLTSTGTSTHATVDINGGAIDGTTIGAASAAAATFTAVTASSSFTVTNTQPSMVLYETDGTSTHSQTWMTQTNDAFQISTRDSTGSTFVGADFRIDKNSSGALRHRFYIAGTEGYRFDGTGLGLGTNAPSAKLDVVGTTELNGTVSITDDLTVDTDTLWVDISRTAVGVNTQPSAFSALTVKNTSDTQIQPLYIDVREATLWAGNAIYIDAQPTASSSWNFLLAESDGLGTPDAEFKLSGDGNGTCDGSWTGGGADYAEWFEWLDGNPDNEDRRGFPVVLVGNKVKIAEHWEDPFGVVSSTPAVVGDGDTNRWKGKYLRDEYGAYVLDANGRRTLNPDFNPDTPYVPRSERVEWDMIGLMGKLRLRKGQPVGSRWIKMRDVSKTIEEWLVR